MFLYCVNCWMMWFDDVHDVCLKCFMRPKQIPSTTKIILCVCHCKRGCAFLSVKLRTFSDTRALTGRTLLSMFPCSVLVTSSPFLSSPKQSSSSLNKWICFVYWRNSFIRHILIVWAHKATASCSVLLLPSNSIILKSVAVFTSPFSLCLSLCTVDTAACIFQFVWFDTSVTFEVVESKYARLSWTHAASITHTNCCVYVQGLSACECAVECFLCVNALYMCVRACVCAGWLSGCPGFADSVYPSCSVVGISPLIQPLFRGSLS